MSFYAYILRCADDSFYTGHTDDFEGRIAAHQQGLVEGYTKTRRPVRLEWAQEFETHYEALSAERQIKGWSRAKKQALIDGNWDLLIRLSTCMGLAAQLGRPPCRTRRPRFEVGRTAAVHPSTSSGRTA